MSILAILASLALQSDVDRWVEQLSAERIEDRMQAAARLEKLGRNLDDAAGLWTAAFPAADPAALLRLGRIREAWRSALHDFAPPEPLVTVASRLYEGLPREDREVLVGLRHTRVSLDVAREPLTDVVDVLRERSGLNIHISGIEDPERLEVSFQSADQPLEAILKQLLGEYGLGHCVRDGVVLITTSENLRKHLKLELYDVSDLVVDLPGDLVARILNRTPKDAWKREEGRSVQFQNGILIVRTSPDVHRTIRGYLNHLRSGQAEEAPRAPDEAVAALFRELSGPGSREAERRLSLLGHPLAEALMALAAGGTLRIST